VNICFRNVQRRDKSRQQGRREAHHDQKREYAAVDRPVQPVRLLVESALGDRHRKQTNCIGREGESKSAGDDRQEDALDEQLSDDPPSCGAERGPDGSVPGPRLLAAGRKITPPDTMLTSMRDKGIALVPMTYTVEAIRDMYYSDRVMSEAERGVAEKRMVAFVEEDARFVQRATKAGVKIVRARGSRSSLSVET
jgi:hypothetical protein